MKIDGVEATEENIVAGKYLLSRPFVMATKGKIDEQNDIVGARTAGIDGVYFRTEISPADDPETSSYAVRSFTGADYEGLLDYVLNA